MVDPQGQANKWIKNMEGGNQLMILDQHMSDMVRRMENAIQFGNPVLLQDVLEEIDPVLEPVLGKSTIKRGNQVLMKLGDKEIDYSPDFRLYVTTKLSNPHYTPEVSTKVTICNFSVKEQGLEAQITDLQQRLADADISVDVWRRKHDNAVEDRLGIDRRLVPNRSLPLCLALQKLAR